MFFSVEKILTFLTFLIFLIFANEAGPANEDIWTYIERRHLGFANAALRSENETLSVVFVYAGMES